MALFDVTLLFELGEERVGAACQRGGGKESRITIVGSVGLSGGFIVVENKALAGSAGTALGRRQSGLFSGRQRHEFPAEIAGSATLAEELDDTAMDLRRLLRTDVACGKRAGKLFKSGADVGNGSLSFLVADLLIGAAEDENQPARDDVAAVGVGELVTQHGELVMFLGQRRVTRASPFLFDG